MPRVVKRSASQAVKAGPSRRSRPNSPLPLFIPPQLSPPVEKPPSGPQWVHEIKLDGFRMAARIDNGHVQLLTRTGLDWTGKYPSAIAALGNVNVKTAYMLTVAAERLTAAASATASPASSATGLAPAT
jgi:bifunctional non-homologous end joining protein LigD